jgi:hypothetical protein
MENIGAVTSVPFPRAMSGAVRTGDTIFELTNSEVWQLAATRTSWPALISSSSTPMAA